MKKLQASNVVRRFKTLPVLAAVFLVVGSGVSVAVVHADQFDQQIQSLEDQNSQKESSLSTLQLQASSYQDAINKLKQQIAGIQNAIEINKARQSAIQQEITANQEKLAYQKKVLGEDLKAMYVGGQMTTVEMLATSKNLSDFVDAETYGSAVQNKIQETMNQITDLENQLQKQQQQVSQLLLIQQQQNTQLNTDRDQQQKLLAYNQGQQDAYSKQLQANEQQIDQLRQQQLLANEQLDSSGQVITKGSCGGSYPKTASGPYGSWGCNYPKDYSYDNWGMGNRECVSYTAWMVYRTYGYMPNWGGVGNANEWPADARHAHIPTGSTPRVGSVAIFRGSGTDPLGHAMWVVGVVGNQIHVYSYNDGYDGNFYDHWVNGSGLTYIYFGE